MKKKMVTMGVVSGLLGVVLLTNSAGATVSATEWKANSPESIQISNNQKEYTMKQGDTLWAIGQKINVKHVKLAEINGIDLSKGDQYALPVGRVLSFGENTITVKNKDGSIYSQSKIEDTDKIDPEKGIGEGTTQENYPYAVARDGLSYPATFKFQGMNVPDSVTLDFSQGDSGKVIFDSNLVKQEYNATFNTIATKEIRVSNIDGTPENRLRTVKVNTEITMEPSNNYDRLLVTDSSNKLYLFVNKDGGISLATPNYAGNYAEGEADVMIEVRLTNSEGTQNSVNNIFEGYSDEQIEYARVTEELLKYYGITGQPIEISAKKNEIGHQVLPFNGSQILEESSVTLGFSMDGTMASTVYATYISNHDGSIRFYQNPNHYQDSRYVTDPDWVRVESEKLVNSTQTIGISTEYDQQAAEIISLIEFR
ncbi:hypothetical protein DOK67_0000666 [Enterococcus sp. DIV0212c]|uniref:LysM peptidoglycan-binding domain-containing protein n=1 Tax=Enterococcus sp. DIV0212c TaxID=2230867 RepID=UPI00325A7A29